MGERVCLKGVLMGRLEDELRVCLKGVLMDG